jgi:plasmid replication initiation protein
MSSRFGPRLYELLVQWRVSGERELALDELQQIWGTSYKRVYDLKKRAIQPAVDDVNRHSDLTVEVGYRKTGKRVTHVQFRFRVKQAKQQMGWKRGEPSKREIEQSAKPGESWEEAADRLRRCVGKQTTSPSTGRSP